MNEPTYLHTYKHTYIYTNIHTYTKQVVSKVSKSVLLKPWACGNLKTYFLYYCVCARATLSQFLVQI